MENKPIEYHYEGNDPPVMLVRFLLPNNDTITIGGNTVEHVFFEVMSRFPDRFSCNSIGFSGDNAEQAQERLKEFFALAKRFGQQ